jgi:hypothetical protein
MDQVTLHPNIPPPLFTHIASMFYTKFYIPYMQHLQRVCIIPFLLTSYAHHGAVHPACTHSQSCPTLTRSDSAALSSGARAIYASSTHTPTRAPFTLRSPGLLLYLPYIYIYIYIYIFIYL